MSEHPLDNPAYRALAGAHERVAERRGAARRYPSDVSPFAGFSGVPSDQDWLDLAELAGPRGVAVTVGVTDSPSVGWEVLIDIAGVQMVAERLDAAHDSEAVLLGAEDVPEMLALVERTKPGPFLPRTIELGTYLGIRRDGALIAMAGERMHPAGWTEISAVCTDEGFRGQGLGARLVRAVAHGIRERGERPFLHASATNVNAIRLYEALGFVQRREINFRAIRRTELPG